MFLRRLHRHQHWILAVAAVLLFVAQLGAATHSLHLDSAGNDTACSFCVAGSHLQSGPQAPVVVAPVGTFDRLLVAVADVCGSRFLASPRTSRGPPLI
jgi:hypothetical protein